MVNHKMHQDIAHKLKGSSKMHTKINNLSMTIGLMIPHRLKTIKNIHKNHEDIRFVKRKPRNLYLVVVLIE